jgi:hypothetical protein
MPKQLSNQGFTFEAEKLKKVPLSLQKYNLTNITQCFSQIIGRKYSSLQD